MSARKNPHAQALGKLGGQAGKGKTSAAKAAAARANGQKGGRPPKENPGVVSQSVEAQAGHMLPDMRPKGRKPRTMQDLNLKG